MKVERSVITTIAAMAALMTFLPWLAGLLSEDVFFEWPFFFEVAIGGLLSGVMYSLVALGFVLIFKASGVFNFAQGAMVLFSALSFVGLLDMGVPIWLCVILTIGIMVLVAVIVERVVLRPLVNQEPIILFMVTIGIAYILDGVGQILWGAEVRTLDIGLPSDPSFFFDGKILINQFDMFAALDSGHSGSCSGGFLSVHPHRSCITSGSGRSSGCHERWNSAAAYLGRCLVSSRACSAGRRHHVGQQTRCSVLAGTDSVESPSGIDSWRFYFHTRRHYRWPDCRRRGESI